MMTNSLERILQGLATSLRETVAPDVGDPYAKAQVLAAVELINNLSTRVEWRRDQLLADIEAARTVLPEPPDFDPDGDLVQARAEHFAALAAVSTDAGKAVVRERLAAELERLRTGMYR